MNESKNICFWYRYVDDVFACFIGSKRQLDLFLKYINNIHPNSNIKFTVEIDVDNKISYLDLTIENKNGRFEFSIYRKPTHTDTTIPYSSNHPSTHKLAAYNSMVHRLLTIPVSRENFEKGRKIICSNTTRS